MDGCPLLTLRSEFEDNVIPKPRTEPETSDFKPAALSITSTSKTLYMFQAAIYGMSQTIPDRSLVKELVMEYIDALYSTTMKSKSTRNGINQLPANGIDANETPKGTPN